MRLQPHTDDPLHSLWQVHEKSVLLVLLPVTLLADHEPELAFWLPLVASFSMYPLLKKDGLRLAYAAAILVWSNLWPTWQDDIMQHSEVKHFTLFCR